MVQKREKLESQSTTDTVPDARLDDIKRWIDGHLKLENYTIEVASADASFRRYFRLKAGNKSWVIMDAPPAKEDCQPFVKVATLLESVGVQSPHIFQFNQLQGFMQLSDLGSTAYLDKLNNESVEPLYAQAIQVIVKMQTIEAELPKYDAQLLQTEMSLFSDWYLQQHRKINLNEVQNDILKNTLELLTESALQQTPVFVHRDYHSRNLMITDNNNPGVIDFQDAVNGPSSYDLVSLIKDCYIAWPREKQLGWIDQYLTLSPLKTHRQQFIKQLDFMGMQRHLKAIGIFARLNHRDAKPGYLNDIPRTLAYVVDVCQRYDELTEFSELLATFNISGDAATLELIK